MLLPNVGMTNPPVPAADVAAVRRFNRFHTQWVGALNEHLLATDYTLPQARVLYEIAQAPRQQPVSAADLTRTLRLDAGYLSRLVAGLEADGLVQRAPAPGHGKRLCLTLTDAGREHFKAMDRASADEVAQRLAPLAPPQRHELLQAMACVRRLLGDEVPATAVATVLRDPQPGDIGLVVAEQARLYTREYGWDWTFEALLAEIASRFINEFKPGRERCWMADRGGRVVGSVFVVQKDAETAQLRMLYVDADARGQGLGRELVAQCVRFAKDAGYRRMVLWTNEVLTAARHIYESAGFQLMSREHHHSFGKDLVGEEWELRW